MENNYLEEKSINNYKTAEYAEKKEYYDVAVSRFYYFLFQNILNFISRKSKIDYDNYREEQVTILNNNNEYINNHEITINYFLKLFLKERKSHDLEDLRNIQKINKLRRQRNDSDYKNMKIETKREYESRFKVIFSKVRKILIENEIINKEESC